MTEANEDLNGCVNAAVYYIVTMLDSPVTSDIQQETADHVQKCNYYTYSAGVLYQVQSKDHSSIILYAAPEGDPRYVCVKHLTNPKKYNFESPIDLNEVDSSATLYSAVAANELDTFLPDTFVATNVGKNSMPTVVIPVSKTGSRGLILLFQGNPTSAAPLKKSSCRRLRASFDPEIKGSVS